VIVETGDEIQFNLACRSYVFEDIEDPTTFILDYYHHMIIFKVCCTATVIQISLTFFIVSSTQLRI
jgi:hypothetical protein